MIDANRAIENVDRAWKNIGFDRRALPMTLQAVHFVAWIESEVMIGGVLGWLVNMGEYGPDTVNAFEAVGAHQCAAIVREILSFFPGGKPATEDQERVRQITAVEEIAEPRWSELGDRLLDWPDDINALLQKFINEHEADFT
jgi:Domain of unknown function (DUF4375)